MEQIISKEEFDELIRIKGEGKGETFKNEAGYILYKEGKEGLKKLEEVMASVGYPIEYKKVKSTAFYPLGVEATTLLAIKRLFNYTDKDFQEMGRYEPKISPFIIRTFMRYFISIERGIKGIGDVWKRIYTVGELRVADYDLKKKYIVLRLKNFYVSPLHCQDLIGHFAGLLEMILKTKVECKEIKCSFRGDEYHEFLFKW
jgi:hypothetical protein